MEWYAAAFRKYAVFKGRARRKEYWMFVLFNLIFTFLAAFLDNICGTTFEDEGFGACSTAYALFALLPSIAVTVRRLHDIGKSGWWLLIQLIPIIGNIWLLVLMTLDGTPGRNKYGPNPKEVA